MSYNIIASRDRTGIIGYSGDLVYRIPQDIEHFNNITTNAPEGKQNAIIMGRKTWDSLPSGGLSGRLNVIITHNPSVQELNSNNVIIRGNFEYTIDELKAREDIHDIFIIGGAQLYNIALRFGKVKHIYMTEIDAIRNDLSNYTYFPYFNVDMFYKREIPHETSMAVNDAHPAFKFMVYSIESLNPEEEQYLYMLREVLEKGSPRICRGSSLRSIFGKRMEFDLSDGRVPILTTKCMPPMMIIKELLWFISGNTSNQTLVDQNVHIWDGNSTREWFDSIGLPERSVGDLGPIYGFQWRHFGAEYYGCDADYTGEGVDQLAECIKQLRNDPTSRRIIMTAWNPSDLSEMALPPCHSFMQWYVEDGGRLSLQLYQRSGDSFLGIPFNIMSYSVFVHMVAQVVGLKPGRFIHIIGDFHVYDAHEEAVREQLSRQPFAFPRLTITPGITDIDKFEIGDFRVDGYEHHAKIYAPMIA
mgnify:CR=1 FL=1